MPACNSFVSGCSGINAIHLPALDAPVPGRPRCPVSRPVPEKRTLSLNQRHNARTCETWGVECESVAVQPLIANRPRSSFLNRASFPFVLISRRMALYSVAAGVCPFGLDQYPLAAICSIIALVVIGSLASARTFAAASMQLSLPSADFALGAFALRAFGALADAVFFVAVLDMSFSSSFKRGSKPMGRTNVAAAQDVVLALRALKARNSPVSGSVNSTSRSGRSSLTTARDSLAFTSVPVISSISMSRNLVPGGSVERRGMFSCFRGLVRLRNIGTDKQSKFAAPVWFHEIIPNGKIPLG